MPLLTLIFRNFYKDIPRELINAAIMDSGSFWRIFVEIVLPMSGNIMVVVLILMITTVWNDYLVGLIFGGIGAKPMTVILANSVVTSRGEVDPQRQHGGGAADRDPAARRLFRARAVLRPGHHRRRDQGMNRSPLEKTRQTTPERRMSASDRTAKESE